MWFKKKKEEVEIPKEEFIAYVYFKDGRIEEIVGYYKNASDFMSQMVDLMEDRKYWFALTTGKEYTTITSREVEYITLDKEQNEEPTSATDNDISDTDDDTLEEVMG